MKTKTTLTLLLMLCITFCGIELLQAQERILALQEPFVILIDPADGSILDPQFIDLTPQNQALPKAIVRVDDELWISDQTDDHIYRYDLSGTFISIITGGLDNIKGMAVVDNKEVWVTNAGSNNGAPGNSIVRFDFDGTDLGSFTTDGSAFDVVDKGNGEVYISYITTATRIERRDYDGNIIGNIVELGVVDFLQQMEIDDENNSIIAGVFSPSVPNGPGLYEFSETDGEILNYYDVGALRGVASLDNGNIVFSTGNNINLLDIDTGTASLLSAGGSSQFFTRATLMPCSTPSTPVGDAVQTFDDGATIADLVVDPTDVSWYATAADAMSNTNSLPYSTLLEDGEDYFAASIDFSCISDPLEVTVNLVLGVNEFDKNSVNLYPNPVTNTLNISSEVSIDSIVLHSVLGQMLLEKEIGTTSATLDVSNLSNGIYLLTVRSGNQIQTLKFIKE
ncbi:MAG TPA: T9SS type A sorting domain-containing protein [Flavobacteriaceae bacterium]|jgi:hypothetical protein|nr:T9SS type A sorting domain-containing protein [Flavobacteriaceae bacterium]HIO00049.1 T9SS type A sorting domain-containing protein [Flavobacteriaceae bacterium]|tara:strand:+ start:15268 stop:16620 length:1353 start_codon:yes stop_codon:yes gene_type:complete